MGENERTPQFFMVLGYEPVDGYEPLVMDCRCVSARCRLWKEVGSNGSNQIWGFEMAGGGGWIGLNLGTQSKIFGYEPWANNLGIYKEVVIFLKFLR